MLQRAGFDLFAYDRRGFGASHTGPDPYTHLGDLIALLDVVAGAEPVWLVGNSAGGGLALDVALAEPARVRGLVLFAPAVTGAPEPRPADLDPKTVDLAERLEKSAGEQRLRLQTHLWLDGPAGPEGRVGGQARELVVEMARAVSAPETAGDRGLAARPLLERIEHPVTVAAVTLDVPAIVDQCRVLAGRLPRGRYVALPGVAHLPPIEAPELTARLVLESLKSDESRSSE